VLLEFRLAFSYVAQLRVIPLPDLTEPNIGKRGAKQARREEGSGFAKRLARALLHVDVIDGHGRSTSSVVLAALGFSRGNSRENRLLKSATQLPFWCFYAPMAPLLEQNTPGGGRNHQNGLSVVG
jgi:hypothetical protein